MLSNDIYLDLNKLKQLFFYAFSGYAYRAVQGPVSAEEKRMVCQLGSRILLIKEDHARGPVFKVGYANEHREYQEFFSHTVMQKSMLKQLNKKGLFTQEGQFLEDIQLLMQVREVFLPHLVNIFIKDTVDSANGRDLTLLIGYTGAGKSTLVNYLLGCSAKVGKINFTGQIENVVVDGEIRARMGEGDSTTLYPETFVAPDSGLAFCDCAGFGDNRGMEEDICASICTHAAINVASAVKSVLLVVDFYSFFTDRGDRLRRLNSAIQDLMKNFALIDSSLFMVISKVPPRADRAEVKAGIRKVLSKMLDTSKAELAELEKDFPLPQRTAAQQARINDSTAFLTTLCFLEQKIDTCVLGDIFDKGATRDEIIRLVQTAPGIQKKAFGISERSTLRRYFDQFLFEVIKENTGLLNKLRELPVSLQENQQQQQVVQDRTRKFAEQSTSLAVVSPVEATVKVDAVTANNVVALLESEVKHAHERTVEVEQGIERHYVKESELQQEHRQLNSADPVLYWLDAVDEKRSGLFGFIHWTTKQFDYVGPPFIGKPNVVKNEGSTWQELHHDPVRGRYTARYQSQFGQDGFAEVRVSVESRNLPDNALRIHQLVDLISNGQREISHLRTEKIQLAKQVEEKLAYIQQIQSTQQLSSAQRKFIDAELQKLSEKQKQLVAEEYRLISALGVAKQEFKERDSEINMVAKICMALNINSALFDYFVSEYLTVTGRLSGTAVTAEMKSDEEKQVLPSSGVFVPVPAPPSPVASPQPPVVPVPPLAPQVPAGFSDLASAAPAGSARSGLLATLGSFNRKSLKTRVPGEQESKLEAQSVAPVRSGLLAELSSFNKKSLKAPVPRQQDSVQETSVSGKDFWKILQQRMAERNAAMKGRGVVPPKPVPESHEVAEGECSEAKMGT